MLVEIAWSSIRHDDCVSSPFSRFCEDPLTFEHVFKLGVYVTPESSGRSKPDRPFHWMRGKLRSNSGPEA